MGLLMSRRINKVGFLQADFENVSVACLLAPERFGGLWQSGEKDNFMNAFMGHLQKTLRKRANLFLQAVCTVLIWLWTLVPGTIKWMCQGFTRMSGPGLMGCSIL